MVSNPSDIPPGIDHLLYRRQFILSSEKIHVLQNGRQRIIAGRYHLSVHPDLECTQVEQDGKSLTLLGFALDPDAPDAGNEAILQRLMGSLDRCGGIFQAVDSLGGRWIMIAHDGSETTMLHDATAQRQIYYVHDPKSGSIICASKPGVIAETLGISQDPRAVDFIHSRKIDDYEIYWMPGDTSLYAEITALLPNHSLSLSTGCCHRFWPIQAPAAMDYGQALSECLRILRGQFDSARRRYPLAVPMTAGWDSRLMLALCRGLADDLYAFTLVYPHLPVASRDVAVPSKLLARLGIKHHLIHYPKIIDEAFKKVFRRNIPAANTAYCADIQALHDHYPGQRVCVTGDAAEIVKCYYERTRSSAEPVSAIELAEFSRLGTHPFAVEAFGKWLREAGNPPLELLDLFCWEQMSGRWQSRIRAEYDIAQESFSPLNNRRLLSVMLSVNPDLRRSPEYKLFSDLISALWPDVLSEPINPPEKPSLSRRLINMIKRTGVQQWVPAAAQHKFKALFR